MTDRALDAGDVLEALPVDVVLVLEPLDLLLEDHGAPLGLEVLAGGVEEAPVGEVERLADRQRDLLGELVADEDEARVPLGVLLFGYEAEELLLALVVRAVGDPVQRVLVHDSLKFTTAAFLNTAISSNSSANSKLPSDLFIISTTTS